MKRRVALALALASALVSALVLTFAPGVAAAAPPARNLCVELREVGASAAASGWQASSGDARAGRERAPQRVCVKNGERASFAIDITRPVQVWQAAGAVLPVPVPTTQWLHAGQRLDVRPRWPGGKAPVAVEIAAHASGFDPSVAAGSAQPPSRTGSSVQTTLEVPLGTWVTIAASGDAGEDRGVVSTSQARAGRVLQMRVEPGP